MKYLTSHEKSDRIAVLVVGGETKLLDAAGVTSLEVELFVEHNLRRFGPCDLVGIYDETFDSPTHPVSNLVPPEKKKKNVQA